MHLSVPFIPILFFHFCLIMQESYIKHRNKLFMGYCIGFIFTIINFTSNLIVLRVREKLGYHYFMDGGFLYPFLILFFFVYTISGLYFLWQAIRTSRGNKR